MLALKSQNFSTSYWQDVVDDALHSIRSFLCASTNCIPHERMFSFVRRSTNGVGVPSWLSTPRPVFTKRHAKSSKYDPRFDKVDLSEANSLYAHARFQDGRLDMVALKHLARSDNIISPNQSHSSVDGESGMHSSKENF